MEPRKYYGSLDGLRALAALVVILQHYLPTASSAYWLFHYGRIGVVVFFVISGFLITNILLGERTKIETTPRTPLRAWRDFYLRRTLRIFPLYYGTILAMYFIDSPPTRERIWWHLLYVSNFGPLFLDSNWGNLAHFWSLCVEEQFYLIIPLPILLLSHRTSLKLISAFAALCVAAKITMAMQGFGWKPVAFSTMGNIEGLYFGALLAYAQRFQSLEDFFRRRLLPLGAVAVALFYWLMHARYLARSSSIHSTLSYLCLIDISITLSFGQLVFWLTRARTEVPILNSAPLRYLGKISYGLYVYHYVLLPFIPVWLVYLGLSAQPTITTYTTATLATGIIIGAAAASWHLLEAPILRLKRRVG